jgi:hypothetical protein
MTYRYHEYRFNDNYCKTTIEYQKWFQTETEKQSGSKAFTGPKKAKPLKKSGRYSTDHKQFNARTHVTRKGGASACEKSMQHLRAKSN